MNGIVKVILGSLLGALGGFAYYYFIGCQYGSCPITSNPYVSILWGMIIGIVIFFPTKKNKGNDKQEHNN